MEYERLLEIAKFLVKALKQEMDDETYPHSLLVMYMDATDDELEELGAQV